MNLINEFIKNQKYLINNHTKKSLKYLYKRGFTDKTIKRFGIGYNDNVEIFNTLFIEGAITIPYYDLRNRIVAFYTRTLDPEADIKHMTSHNFPLLYEKGKMFYNLNNVLRKYYNSNVFVVEGQLDCISMHQAGFKNTIAIVGNKMSDFQNEIIYRYFDKIYFVADNDEPGNQIFKCRKKLKKLSLYKIKIDKDGYKDVNDLLKGGIDIKKYFKRVKEKMS